MQDKAQRTSQQSGSRSPLNKRSNAILLKIAGGPLRAFSLLKHVGRSSGKAYATPHTLWAMGL